jgi:hypothetical protein
VELKALVDRLRDSGAAFSVSGSQLKLLVRADLQPTSEEIALLKEHRLQVMELIIDRPSVSELPALETNSGNCRLPKSAESANRGSLCASVTESPVSHVSRCGSSVCSGCYEVAPGISLHPPKCGEDYRGWLERWERKDTPR